MLQSLLWDDEVRQANFPELDETIRLSKKELEMSASLVDSFSTDFEPDKFTDEYQEQLRRLIDEKLKHGDAVDTDATFGEDEEDKGGEVLDLMEALRRSIEKNKSGKAGGSGKGGSGAGNAGKKKSSRKKATA